MSTRPEDSERPGLVFFGRMAASISHELKNVLAIVNENAGLLDDHANLVDQGVPVDGARLARIAAQLGQQVRRADAIVRNLHQLAHSTDACQARIDLNTLMQLLADLHGPLAKLRGVSLELLPAPTPILLDTDPMLLESLVAACLEWALHQASGERIQVAVQAAADGALLCFSPVAGPGASFPPAPVQRLAARLGATIRPSAQEGNLLLILPKATIDPP